jgi:hypothetical protein
MRGWVDLGDDFEDRLFAEGAVMVNLGASGSFIVRIA